MNPKAKRSKKTVFDTDVRVTNSQFDNGDDCVCLQTSMTNKPCKNIFIADCNFSGRWAGIRVGLLSHGNFDPHFPNKLHKLELVT